MSVLLNVDSISCHYDLQAVVEELSFHVNAGDICCLLGPSGCGKTTVLRSIAGFQHISSGAISLNEKILSTSKKVTPPEKREIGMMFQDYALFPHLTVEENVRFGISRKPKPEQKHILESAMSLVKLTGMEKRYPHELSGGQKQRVALARAIAPGPKLLLLDEPFSNLDAELRKALALEVRSILKESGIGAIMVTHDQEEAFAFGDHIGLIQHGKLQQWDTPFNMYHEPANRNTANFIGGGVFIPGFAIDGNSIETELGIINGNRAYPWSEGMAVEVLLRPDDIELDDNSDMKATVIDRMFSGSATLYNLKLTTGSVVQTMVPSHHDYPEGSEVGIVPHIEHLIAFAKAD